MVKPTDSWSYIIGKFLLCLGIIGAVTAIGMESSASSDSYKLAAAVGEGISLLLIIAGGVLLWHDIKK